jgi:hypothetical protein
MAKKYSSEKFYTSGYMGAGVEQPLETLGSVNRPGQPIIFPGAAKTPMTVGDINAPGSEAYGQFANEALAEDLDAMAGRNRFGESQLPGPPLTDDQFRYTGDYEIKKNDPLLSSPMTKTNTGISNRGIGIWSGAM